MRLTFRFVLAVGIVVVFAIALLTAATQDRVPKYNASGTLVDSTISEVNGKVGIGTVAPVVSFHVYETVTMQVASFESTRSGVGQGTYIGLKDHTGGVAHDTALIGSVDGNLVLQTIGGNVGIGTISPTAKLHIAGNVTVDGNIAAKYQDVAEWVPSKVSAQAGTVMVIDPNRRNGVDISTAPYDSAIAGVVSPNPGITLGERAANDSLIAHSGRVLVNVDASSGAIRPGDLLVTSRTPGHAMRSKPLDVDGSQLHRPGTILGKALEPHAKGTGQILVLLTLE